MCFITEIIRSRFCCSLWKSSVHVAILLRYEVKQNTSVRSEHLKPFCRIHPCFLLFYLIFRGQEVFVLLLVLLCSFGCRKSRLSTAVLVKNKDCVRMATKCEVTSLTHTHTHTHTHSHTRSHSNTLSLKHNLTHTHTHTHTRSRSHTLSLTHAHTHTHSHIHNLTHSLTTHQRVI